MSPNSFFTRDRNARRNPMRDFSNMRRARLSPLHRHDFAQIWYIIEGEFTFGGKLYGPGTIAYMPDPHFEDEMQTATGGTIFFVQYPGPTTGAPAIYDGRMNLKEAPPLAQQDLEH